MSDDLKIPESNASPTPPEPQFPLAGGTPPPSPPNYGNPSSFSQPPPPPPRDPYADLRKGMTPIPPIPPMPSMPPRNSSGGFLRVALFILFLCGFGLFGLMLGASYLFRSDSSSSAFKLAGGLGIGSHELGLLRIEGPIMEGVDYDFWMQSLTDMADDAKIKGIVIRINSPGGSVGASQEIYDKLEAIRAGKFDGGPKKIYVSMGDVAASGGYYIAAAADRIIANRGSLTGSIGVISTSVKIEELAKDIGIGMEVTKTGRFKDAGSMFRPTTEDEKKMFNTLLNDAYQQFLDDVFNRRSAQLATALTNFGEAEWEMYQFTKPESGTSRDFLKQIADGRVYSGAQALKLGLVDELGSLEHALGKLASDLNIEGRPGIYEPHQKRGFFQMIESKVGNVVSKADWARSSLQYRMIPF